MVARIRGDGSPILLRHSCLMKVDTSGGNFSKWARTLFFSISPLSDLVGSSERKNSMAYRKVPKFSDAIKLCCNLPKIQTKSSNLSVFRQNGANGIANSEDPDQTAPLVAV